MPKLALHYQILIAMVLGAVIGVIVNPGDIKLVDATFAVSDNEGEIYVETAFSDDTDVDAIRTRTWQFADRTMFASQYPELATLYELREDTSATLTVTVTDRHAHITETISKIEINYTRKLNGKTVVTRLAAPSGESLETKFPQWAEFYKQHGGGVVAQITIWSRFVGDLFLRLLKMITVPLILTSLVTGVAGLGATSRLGSMFGKTLLYYLCTSVLAILTGVAIVNVIGPGVGVDLPGTTGDSPLANESPSLTGVFTGLVNNLIPTNPVHAIANSDFLSIIAFSILLGIFIIRVGGESGERLRGLFAAGFDVMMHMTLFIIALAPIGVFAFMLYATASQGLEIFRTLAWYMLTVFLGLVFHATVILPLIVRFVARRSPLDYARAMSPALMTAFSTASSNGTLPLTITCVEERAGVSNRVSSFVLPLGATINMDGTALYEAVAVLFIAQATPGIDLTIGQQLLVAITALLASIGAAGIPHAGLVMMVIVLEAVGLPTEAQGVIIAVDRVLDMCRTTVNVWSDSCGCAVMDRLESQPES